MQGASRPESSQCLPASFLAQWKLAWKVSASHLQQPASSEPRCRPLRSFAFPLSEMVSMSFVDLEKTHRCDERGQHYFSAHDFILLNGTDALGYLDFQSVHAAIARRRVPHTTSKPQQRDR